jgi:cytochrome P450
MTSTAPESSRVDFSDLEFWGRPIEEREAAFAHFRADEPVPVFEEPEPDVDFIQKGPGYYMLTKHKHVLEASRQPEIFISGRSATGIFDMPPEFAEFFGSMINMDDPKHARLRRIVSRGFTPRMLAKVEDQVQQAAERIVDDILAAGSCDFVPEIAAKLPLKIICDMMGIPEKDYQFIFERSNVILGASDPEFVPDGGDIAGALLTAGSELSTMVQELGRYRRDNPVDDVTSKLVTASGDGETLTDQELGSFFILLVVAGNETTRNAIAHGLHFLTQNPDQKQLWLSDFERYAPTAVEEIVRYASPVAWMRRSVTRDYTLEGGHELKEGDKVLLYYWSADRDEEVFTDPLRFDITRDPNPHVGFGGPGPHFCLGAHLARREITVMFRELFRRMPDIHAAGEPDRLRSSFINGIKHLPAQWTPAT